MVKVKDEDKVNRRRIYMRNMMRLYRQEDREALAYLTERAAALTAELADLQQRRRRPPPRRSDRLSWCDIAAGMGEALVDAQQEHKTLHAQVQRRDLLLQHVERWVHRSLSIGLTGHLQSLPWRQVLLPGDSDARLLAKTWIAQHLYMHTSRMFEQFGFPSSIETPLSTLDVAFHDELDATHDDMQVVIRRQAVSDVPLGDLALLYRLHLGTLLMGHKRHATSNLVEATPTTTLHRMVADGECVNLLGGEFHTPDSCVFVVQQITCDDRCDDDGGGLRQRHRMMWFDMRRLPDGRTAVRNLNLIGRLRTADAAIPLVEEAREIGCDLTHVPLEHQARCFRAHFQNLVGLRRASMPTRMMDLWASLKAQRNTSVQ
ncbi:Aste57867_16130 [Aphanomyces stellatus]|uniref:Aste57867_16130 protein n=1 Tax=Aphanomyces stellatus TaxID=120398 RepID=A0A485L5R8_9STRA|nr:hypothetical protein As57867_016074 [Aphanomyces stellatus]VFT92912.1 Aste57867_16130 [Aphanomyces stellatus]